MNPHTPRMVAKRSHSIQAKLSSHQILLIQPRLWQEALAGLDSIDVQLVAAHTADNPDETDIYGDPLPKPQIVDGMAFLPIQGILAQGLPSIAKCFGYQDPRQISGWLQSALTNDNVKEICLLIDSPGGSACGIPELAAQIRAGNEIKRVTAHTNSLMASAAYWLASQTYGITASSSAEIGSIGVYRVVDDTTQAFSDMGVKREVFKSGPLKATGMSGVSLTDAQRQHLQHQVDYLYGNFSAAVLGMRPGVSADAMQGQTFFAPQAVTAGLVDKVV